MAFAADAGAFSTLRDEENGWAAVIETAPARRPIVLSYLGREVLPPPIAVAAFLKDVLAFGYFAVKRASVGPQFGAVVSEPAVKVRTGDFNADGRADLAVFAGEGSRGDERLRRRRTGQPHA